MNALMFEPLLRDATIKAIDAVARKLAGAHGTKENAVTRLLNRWNAMTREEKERAATIVVISTATAVTALAALRGGKKKGVKRASKSAARKVARRIAG
ncbi:MAG TPA: hypothetical protein VNA04_09370 [Thermoanaerobaculia bacterium]|nr:hypothetical protein [Thermoanaerobaculia bacterium]